MAQCFDLYTTKWAPVWIIDPPLFELDGNNRYSSVHHPFTSPVDDNAVDANSLSKAYDLVLNGSEVGGGSIRIHKLDVQKKIFEMLGMDPEHAAEVEFKHLCGALKYGTPPHGGFAMGLDRLMAIMLDEISIREVIAFPKTQSGFCPLTGAPSQVAKEQLLDLHLAIRDTNS